MNDCLDFENDFALSAGMSFSVWANFAAYKTGNAAGHLFALAHSSGGTEGVWWKQHGAAGDRVSRIDTEWGGSYNMWDTPEEDAFWCDINIWCMYTMTYSTDGAMKIFRNGYSERASWSAAAGTHAAPDMFSQTYTFSGLGAAHCGTNTGGARRSSAEHLIATKALRCTATAWMLTVAYM